MATLGVFAPSQIFIALLTHWYERFKSVAAIKNVMVMTLAAVTGLIAGVSVTLGISLIHTVLGALLAVVVAILALRVKKIPYWAFILGAALFGTIRLKP